MLGLYRKERMEGVKKVLELGGERSSKFVGWYTYTMYIHKLAESDLYPTY